MKSPHGNARGVTLLEILVTLVVSSVVLLGLTTLFMASATDFNTAARLREERYSQELLESELIWRLRAVPGEFLPTDTRLAASTVTYTDETGAQVRKVLTYDYPRNDTRTVVAAGGGT